MSFLSENFQYLDVKFSIYLNRLVFVMLRCFCLAVTEINIVVVCRTPFPISDNYFVYAIQKLV